METISYRHQHPTAPVISQANQLSDFLPIALCYYNGVTGKVSTVTCIPNLGVSMQKGTAYIGALVFCVMTAAVTVVVLSAMVFDVW